jgi:hypothetical protein
MHDVGLHLTLNGFSYCDLVLETPIFWTSLLIFVSPHVGAMISLSHLVVTCPWSILVGLGVLSQCTCHVKLEALGAHNSGMQLGMKTHNSHPA